MSTEYPSCLDLISNVNSHGTPGEWKSILTIPVPYQPNAAAYAGWHIVLTFDQTIEELNVCIDISL